MQQKSIAVICRHNQARSVMAAAAVTRFFPDFRVSSAGIEAIEGQRIPQSILNLADSWGLDVLDFVSHSLQAVEEQLVTSDFIVVAEDEFIPHIIDFGVAPQKILSMQDQRFDHALVPFDPIGQGDRVLSVELAKSIMTTMQLLRVQPGLGFEYPVEAIFTEDEADLQNKLGLIWDRSKVTNHVVLLADFRAPNFRAVSQVCGGVLELKVNRASQVVGFFDGTAEWELHRVLARPAPFALSGKFEMDQVERFVLGSQFTRLVSALASHRPVTILTEPMGLGPCAFLTAANANIGPIFE